MHCFILQLFYFLVCSATNETDLDRSNSSKTQGNDEPRYDERGNNEQGDDERGNNEQGDGEVDQNEPNSTKQEPGNDATLNSEGENMQNMD